MAQVSALPQTGAWLRGIFGAAAEQANGFYGEMTPNVNVRYAKDTLRPSQAMTIDESRRLEVDHLLKRMYLFTTTFNSWEFKVLPLKASDFMVDEWEAEITRLTLLQQTVEGLTPQLIEIEKERHAVRKKHWQQGFEIKGENFMTPQGKHEFSLKYGALQMNVIATMQQQIKKAIMSFPDYWAQHQKIQGPVFPNGKAVMAQEINMHGVLNQEKGVYAAINHMKRRTRGDVREPVGGFDTMVLASGQLEKNVYDMDKSFETEAYRSGDANAKKMLLQGADGMISKLGGMVSSIYEDTPKPATNKPMTELDLFKQNFISTAHFVINADALGPKNPRGVREPMVQAMALPLNDWHTFRLTECCEHDPTFDDNGEIDDGKMRRLLANLGSYLQQYDFSDGSVPDPFLWRSRFNVHNGQLDRASNEPGNFNKVEYIGDFEESVRSPDEDLDAANKMAENDGLTESQRDLLMDFKQAMDSVRVPPPSMIDSFSDWKDDIAQVSEEAMTSGAYMDNEWGGPTVEFINALGPQIATAWKETKPYGFGSVAGMLSLLKSIAGNTNPSLFAAWEHRDLINKYPLLKTALDKVWAFLKRATPTNALATQRLIPVNSVTAFKDSASSPHIADNARRCAILSSLFTGHRYPLFVDMPPGAASDDPTLDNFNDFAGLGTSLDDYSPVFKFVLASSPPEQVTRAVAAGSGFKKAWKQWTTEDFEVSVENILDKPETMGLTKENAWKALVMMMGYVLTLSEMAGTDGDLDMRGVAAYTPALAKRFAEDYDLHHRGVPDDQTTREKMMTPLHFGNQAWKNPQTVQQWVDAGYYAADPEYPTVVLGALLSLKRDLQGNALLQVAARERFGRTRLGAKLKKTPPTGYNTGTATRLRSATTGFAMEQGDHFIGASAGLQPGGPFVASRYDTDANGNQSDVHFVERRNMINRFAYVKQCISDPLKRMYAFAVLTSRPSLGQNRAFIDHGIPSMFGCIGFNIAIQQIMDALVLIKSGGETGFLAHNYANSNFGQDPGHKELKFNLTLWMGAVVTNGANINILPGAGYAGFTGGLDTDVIKDRAALVEMGKSRAKLRQGASMMFFVVPASYSRQVMLTQSNPCTLGGKIDPSKLKYRLEPRYQTHHNKQLPFPGWIRANNEYDFDQSINGRKPHLAYSYEALRRNQNIPLFSMHRAVREYNAMSGKFEPAYRGSAHIDNAGFGDLQQTLSGEVVIGKRHQAVQDAIMSQ